MLSEIRCNAFAQKVIKFQNGLNVILGTDSGTNSIGKSTFLLIVDYAFGGKAYASSIDILRNVEEHDIFFSFVFNDDTHIFSRSNTNSGVVWKCNAKYEKIEEITLDEYCNWLNKQYEINLPALSFRDAVGRYIRVYTKKNCDEFHPLHYFPTEKSENAIFAFLKLCNEYAPLEIIQKEAKASKDALEAFKKAQRLKFVANITKKEYEANITAIGKLHEELQELSDGLENNLLDVNAVASEHAVYIKKLLSRVRRARSLIKSRYDALDENGEYKFSATTDNFQELVRFFPGANIARIEEIENFHKQISSIFKKELSAERKKIKETLDEYDAIIQEHESQLRALITDPKLSKMVLTKHADILKQIERMQNENEAYLKKEKLLAQSKADADRYDEIKLKQFAITSLRVNTEMQRINDLIYNGLYQAPQLCFTNSSYRFFTPDDTGTGIAYKGLIVYDLAMLTLTKLPILVHDSVILKQISDDAIERIMELYAGFDKQVIIALDKQSSYSSATEKTLLERAILILSPGGGELFGRSWG
ncbi:MAG: DUF2326 domain-containing protein [Ruminococcaceae bacterium]|nr:DUF2326 domain-containing protein [Oscillospiraceae bacterium]